jgi:FAD synthase
MPSANNDRIERPSPQFATFRSPDEWIARQGDARPRTTVTIGNFDGVHLGHQRIIRGVIDRSRETGTQSMLLTFFAVRTGASAADDSRATPRQLP